VFLYGYRDMHFEKRRCLTIILTTPLYAVACILNAGYDFKEELNND
jgi:hypothetical protein